MMRLDTAWQSEMLARTFLEGVRGGIPYAADQLEIMLRFDCYFKVFELAVFGGRRPQTT